MRCQVLCRHSAEILRFVAPLVLCSITACGVSRNTENRVVVYTSVDRIFSEPVLQEAGRALGLEVIGVYDTEETKSTGLVNRLLARKENPDGDIFWSGDPARAALLKTNDVTAPFNTEAASHIPGEFKDPDGHWIGFSARTRVLLVNTDLVAAGEEPKGILELTEAKWKSRVAIANPLFGTTSFHIAALFETLGQDRAWEWLNGLKANEARILSSNGEVKRHVAQGLVAVGLTDSDDAAEAIADGQPVRAVLLDQSGTGDPPLGTLVMPNTLSLIRGGPNPEKAKSVMSFLLSDTVLEMLAESCAQAPLKSGLDLPSKVIRLDGVLPMSIDYAAVAERLEAIMPALKEWLDQS